MTVDHAPRLPVLALRLSPFLYEPPPESARVLVDADLAAAHLANLGLTLREAARLSGLGVGTLQQGVDAGGSHRSAD